MRIYDPAHVEAWQTLRHELSKTLGRMPSLSEVAEVAARALLDDEQARTRAGQLLAPPKRYPRSVFAARAAET